jgi:glycosyltransferase involved in cell wall biosynthesis
VGHLSGYSAELQQELRRAIGALLHQVPRTTVLCIGRGSEAFASAIGDARVRATGELTDGEVAVHVAACDVMIAPFDEGITTRRTSVLLALAAGVPVVATDGRHTEPVWRTSRAVDLVPAADPNALAVAAARLLASSAERRALSQRGRAFYDSRFSPAALLAALGRTPVEHAAAHFPGR